MRLEVDGLSHHYGSALSLQSVGFTLPSGGCVAVMGTNGAGKTTLLKCVMGLEPASAGTIRLDGEVANALKPFERVRRGIGYVPQGREIFPDLSVLENLEIATDFVPPGEHKALFERVYGLFPVLWEMRRRRGGDLSGGQQQQLAIGRALMGRPRLLILDEPTEGIQPNVIQSIEDVITQLKGEMSILLVEQYFDFAKSVGDDYLVLARGAVMGQGRTADLEAEAAREMFSM